MAVDVNESRCNYSTENVEDRRFVWDWAVRLDDGLYLPVNDVQVARSVDSVRRVDEPPSAHHKGSVLRCLTHRSPILT
jgi:hypothetical protein